MDQTLLVHFLLCYVMIAAIVARPLPSDKEKRQSSMRQMEDVQFSESGTFPVRFLTLQQTVTHRRSWVCNSNREGTRPVCFYTHCKQLCVNINNIYPHHECSFVLCDLLTVFYCHACTQVSCPCRITKKW